MTQDLFAQFDKMYDVAGLQDDIKAAAENKTDFEEVPDGDYEVHIQKLELKQSKSGNPMVSCWFKILEGSRKGSIIFMNQVITQGFQIHIVNEFLRSLGTSLDVEFKSYSQYAKLLANILDVTEDFDYALEYTHNSKGFAEFKITDVFELAD
jgi:hypothetical protein